MRTDERMEQGHDTSTLKTVSDPARPTIRIVRTEEDFDRLEGAWKDLVDRCDVSVFQTYEWQRTWWEYFRNGNDLHIIVFESDGRIVGIAPLTRARVSILGIPVASYMSFIGVGLSDYIDLIIEGGHEQAVLGAFTEYLADTREQWDVFDLQDINESTATFRLLPSLFRERGLPLFRYQGNVCPRIQLPPTFEELLRQCGPSTAYNLKRKSRRLLEKYESSFEIISGESDDIAAAIWDFAHIHGSRWKSQGHPSAFDDPRHRDFHAAVSRKFAFRGWLRIFFLTVNGKRTAVSFNFNFKSVAYMYQSNAFGSDEVMKYSPGFLVRAEAISRAIGEGVRTFDFLRGNESYKYSEWDATDSTNWLLRTSSATRRKQLPFLLFLFAEFAMKTTSRMQREYYEFRRFRVSGPEQLESVGYIGKRIVELGSLAIGFFRRHMPWFGKQRGDRMSGRSGE